MPTGSPLAAAPTAAEWTLLARLVLAIVAGGAVGWNRHRAGKPAGVGTHALVSLGSALLVGIPVAAGAPHDIAALSRIVQGVAAGVGFLGAGEIFRGDSGKVTGLTSAAALWASAALGMLIAAGSAFVSLAATAFVLLVLALAPRVERRIEKTITPP